MSNLIKVYQLPTAAFSYNPQPTTLDNPNIAFTDQSTNGDTCVWLLGDGHTVVVPGCGNIAHTYSDTGNYQVTEIVRTNHGCVDTIKHDVIISPNTIFYIPNAFTPNNDGLNDVFKPSGSFVSQYELLIFDRWGNEIFKSNDINTGWDGTVQGSSLPCMVDVYVYSVKYNDYFGNPHKFIGSVSLIH
jgi:gliding motility-associated-like protein